MTGRLVVVGTPIGNLEDISPRAVRALGEAGAIFCEDTRRTRGLLSALGLPAPRLYRLDSHTERSAAAAVVSQLGQGRVVALVSDAGMPTISDPGALVVKEVAAAGWPTEVIPGPCAVSAALALSGLPASQYRFAGFLPRKGRERRQALALVAAETATTVIYEAPNRVAATVDDLMAVCGPERELAAARELTKIHEQVWHGNLARAVEWLASVEARGEWVLMVGPRPVEEAEPATEEEISAALTRKMALGTDRKQAVAEVAAELRVPKRRVYERSLRRDGGP